MFKLIGIKKVSTKNIKGTQIDGMKSGVPEGRI